MYSFILTLHIAAGIIAIPSGFMTFFLRKGGNNHRKIGNLFSWSMIIMAMGAIYLGYVTDDIPDIISGMITIYLVATAQMALGRHPSIKIMEGSALCIIFSGCLVSLFLADDLVNYIATGIMAFAFLLDLNWIFRGEFPFKYALARHVWRMSLALFIAVGSFFLGQMQIFPKPLNHIGILSFPIVGVVILMILWLIRIWVGFLPKSSPALVPPDKLPGNDH